MRRIGAVHCVKRVMIMMIVGCLLVGVAAAVNVNGPVRPGPRPKPRTPRPSPTPMPDMFDFGSTTNEYDDNTASPSSQPEGFAAGTVRPQTPEPTALFDITSAPPASVAATASPLSPSPTTRPPKHVYDEPTKPPTPAPTPASTPLATGASAKTQSPSPPPSSATPSPQPSTKLPTTQPSSSPLPTWQVPPPEAFLRPIVTSKSPVAETSTPPPSTMPSVAPEQTTAGDPSEGASFSTPASTATNGTSEGTTLRTAAPESATPQAISGSNMTTPKSKWSLLIVVGSIATVAVVAALLIWRDTRRIRRRTCVSETLPAQSKNTSCELDFDWYPPSPSLTSAHQSVDTFMGRLPRRKESEAHVSSRAASTGDLLNVSSIGDRSTRSDPSSRSETIHEHKDEDRDSQSTNSSNTIPRVDEAHTPVSRSGRTDSSPPVSFDEEVNALSDWEGSDYDRSRANSAASDIDTDASVEMIFKQHRKAFLQAQGEGSPRDRASNLLATWTSSLPRSYVASADKMTCSPTDSGTDFKFDEDESKSDEGRDSNGSAYSAVPSCAVILEDYSIMMTSFHSDWSALTATSGKEDEALGSDRSIGTYDEEL